MSSLKSSFFLLKVSKLLNLTFLSPSHEICQFLLFEAICRVIASLSIPQSSQHFILIRVLLSVTCLHLELSAFICQIKELYNFCPIAEILCSSLRVPKFLSLIFLFPLFFLILTSKSRNLLVFVLSNV